MVIQESSSKEAYLQHHIHQTYCTLLYWCNCLVLCIRCAKLLKLETIRKEMNGKRAFFTPFDKTANVMDLWCRAARSVQTTHWHIGRTVRTGHAPSEKGAVGVNVLTVDQRIRLRNSPFNNWWSYCKKFGTTFLLKHRVVSVNARSPTVESYIRRITSCKNDNWQSFVVTL